MTFEQDIKNATEQLDQLDRIIRDNLQGAARAGAGVFKAEAMRRAPVKSGKLKSSFEDRPGRVDEKTAVHSGVHVVYNTAFYAAPVEYGPHKRPFMRPAAAAAEKDMVQAMETHIKRAVARIL